MPKNEFMILKNEGYEIYFPKQYEKEMKQILEYSTNKLQENLAFFHEKTYGKRIKASFFYQPEDFFKRIHELDEKATPPKWAPGCFYGEENQILIKEEQIKNYFLTLAHETCHLLFEKFIYEKYKERIIWLDESFAAMFSGEIENDRNKGTFNEKVKKYLNKENLPNMNTLSFKKNNVITKEYNGYDFFQIIGKFLKETMTQEELLAFYKDEQKVLEVGEHILKDSLNYFKSQLK